MNILLWIVLGAIAGWLANILMKSKMSLIGNIIIGVIGAFVGGLIMNLLGGKGVTEFSVWSILVAVGGACLCLYLYRLIKK